MRNSARVLRTKLVLAFGIAAVALALASFAQDKTMYTWTDENGVVHFSDRAPEGREVQAQQLPESPLPGSVSPTLDAGSDSQPSVAQQRREEIARKTDEARARREQQQAECTAMRAELARIEPNRRVFFTNEQGETERMDDVVRTDRVAELRDLISRNCD